MEPRHGARLKKSGQAPEWLSVCDAQNGLITWRHENKPVILLFTTPLAAKDYIAVAKVAAEVREFKVESLQWFSVRWEFELIAFLARMDSDQAANLTAIEPLKDFGPEFADWPSRWSTS